MKDNAKRMEGLSPTLVETWEHAFTRLRRMIGIEIGGTKLQVLGIDLDRGREVGRRAPVEPPLGAPGILRNLAAMVEAVASELGAVEAVSVGFGGPVCRSTGTTLGSSHVAGWKAFPLLSWLREQLGDRPLYLENDTNAAALAEAILGAGRAHSHVLYSNNGSGIGAGLVVHGRIYHGAGATEMELGHLRVGRSDAPLQATCSGWAIDRWMRERRTAPAADDLRTEPGGMNPVDRAVARQERDVLEFLDARCRDYALGLSHAAYLLNPSVIVLGGGVARMGEPWRSAVERHLRRWVRDPIPEPPVVKLSILGERVVPLGAMILADRLTGKPVLPATQANDDES